MRLVSVGVQRLVSVLLVITFVNNNSRANGAELIRAQQNNHATSTVGPVINKQANGSSTVQSTRAPAVTPLAVNHEKAVTKAPTIAPAPAAAVASAAVASKSHAATIVTTAAPVVAHPSVASIGAISSRPPLVFANAKAPAATIKPAPGAALNASVNVNVAKVNVAQRLNEYFEPICEQLDKLAPKQMFKIQSQMKQFIEKTAGKMSLCFMQHYSMDPNLTPANKAQLGTICASRKLANVNGTSNSFRSFQACAEQNWDNNLDAEIERITRLRVNCVKNHPHSKNDLTISLSHDDEFDAALIGDVVSKVFDNNKSAVNKADIKLIDIGSATKKSKTPQTTNSTGALNGNSFTFGDNNKLADKKILNDPNTVVVFVDEPAPATTTPKPQLVLAASSQALAVNGTKLASGTAAPAAVAAAAATASTKNLLASTPVPLNIKLVATNNAPLAPTTTTKLPTVNVRPTFKSNSSLVNKTTKATTAVVVASVQESTSKPVPVSTSAPSHLLKVIETKIIVTTAKPAPSAKVNSTTSKVEVLIGDKKGVNVATSDSSLTSVEIKKGVASTIKPTLTSTPPPTSVSIKVITRTTSKTSAPLVAQQAATTSKSTVKATIVKDKKGGNLDDVLKKQEKEKKDLEIKLKVEREKITQQLQKKQDEIDAKNAKNAIKALQLQRAQQTHNHHSDEKMHQIEHQRQMSIDPVGHTLKHQQYEKSKQLKAAAAAATNKKV